MGGDGRFEKKKIPAKPNHATRRAIKNASTALKTMPAPLASEKKNLALTNSSTLPHNGQMVHP